MTRLSRPALRRLPLALLTASALSLTLGSVASAHAGTLVDISAEAAVAAANDLVRATLFAEASGSNPKSLSTRINGLMANALRASKSQGGVKAQSGGTRTYPVYGKNGQIESWRMRSELTLESRDPQAISDLIGRLQENLGVSGIQFMPAPETRKSAEDEAIKAAISAFQERARLVASSLGQSYKIKQMSINSSGHFRPPVVFRKAAAMQNEAAAPMPMESGESQVQVNISGQIEFAD